ncbi:MAG: primosomal protein N' [Rickettsiales bacterium]|jgi:primosomal protein N' (replication factor Y)|nr:primosomal protein N' [Rickettsiales bacterium]
MILKINKKSSFLLYGQRYGIVKMSIDIENKQRIKYFYYMFKENDIVKVLIPNAANSGYDYRLAAPAEIGAFVLVSIIGRPYVGVIIGSGDSGLAPEKIKPVQEIYDSRLQAGDLDWIARMSEWTMMNPGAVLRLILNVSDIFSPPVVQQLYSFDFNEKKRMTESRQAVADAFAANDNQPMGANDICNIARVSPAVVRTMIKKGILSPAGNRAQIAEHKTQANYFDTGNIVLNAEQQAAANEMAACGRGFSVFVLDGITGSGKTQVYFDAAMRAYAAGKSVLLMMPEIALTAQFISRFAGRFGAPPVVWHSNLTAARRRDIWRGVAAGQIRMVVGTRSALFLPWQNLGLIVVDEEHDGSYKQEDMGNYHARDMAVLRAKIAGFPIVLASATPAAETVKNIRAGKYKQLRLASRFGGANMPLIETIDMRKETPESYAPPGGGNLSPTLCKAIEETLGENQQIMLFINRRGFAPIVQCKKCGWGATCPDCSVGMTYHKKVSGKLLCHICGRSSPMPGACPDCGGEISMRGAGLEKIQEEVHAKFPAARTALVSSDTMMSRQAMERLVGRMESGEIDIVIGTQILAKGHHFPNLTLVGVVDADMGLFGPDFRAGEHSFQQLFQVAGRAGRGQLPGRVLLQTYQPEHSVIKAICAGGRDAFMNADLEARKAAGMPPFGQLIAVIVEAQKELALQKYCADLAAIAPKLVSGDSKLSAASPRIMGPIPAQIYQIRNWFRMRFLVAGDERANLQPIVRQWLSRLKVPANVRVKIDVNPQNFL